MSDILWPAGYVPGFTDNFCSNEVIVTGLTADDIWPFLNIPERWPTYYANSADISFHDGKGPAMRSGTLRTVGFLNAVDVEATCFPRRFAGMYERAESFWTPDAPWMPPVVRNFKNGDRLRVHGYNRAS